MTGWLRKLLSGSGGAGPPVAQPQPDAAALRARGNAALAEGRLDDAASSYRAAVQADPGDPLARVNLGFACLQSGNVDEAVQALNDALALRRPGNTFEHDAHFLLARACCARGEFEKAMEHAQAAVAIAPDFADGFELCAMVALELRRPADALQAVQRLQELRPSPETGLLHAQALCARGAQLRDAREHLEALACHEQALALQPQLRDAHAGRAQELVEVLRLREGVEAAREGLRYHPQDPELHWVAAIGLLLQGEFEAGWREHEWRWQVTGRKPPDFGVPRWHGEPISASTILLFAEQGLGDSIQFLRFVPVVAARAKKVILHVPYGVHPLAAAMGLPSNCELVEPGSVQRVFDVQCPLLSLPLALGLRDVPAAAPYLRADPARIAAWRERLGAQDASLRVGLVWSGSATHKNDHRRSIALERLKALAVPGVRFFGLQPEVRDSDAHALASWPDFTTLGAELADFADTAALLEALDLVISVDTSVAHLAGALARPVWILLPHCPDWRWITGRNDSPWYPTARLLRQEAAGDWDTVIARAAKDLAALASAKEAGRGTAGAA